LKITLVAGARPNFIKIAPIIKAIEKKQNEGEKLSYRFK
jgi:UDP-N-acetylglucosamine 2-epimerase (non-hydrolysing)